MKSVLVLFFALISLKTVSAGCLERSEVLKESKTLAPGKCELVLPYLLENGSWDGGYTRSTKTVETRLVVTTNTCLDVIVDSKTVTTTTENKDYFFAGDFHSNLTEYDVRSMMSTLNDLCNNN